MKVEAAVLRYERACPLFLSPVAGVGKAAQIPGASGWCQGKHGDLVL